jgi:hypothetical protein
MKKLIATVAAVLLAIAVLLGVFDDAYLLLDLLQRDSWTAGSYHQPVLYGIEIFTGTVLGMVLMVCLFGMAQPRFWRQKVHHAGAIAGVIGLVGCGAVSSLWLLSIHVNEVDVASGGFRQNHFTISVHDTLRFFDTGPAPVTVCLGRSGQCVAGPSALGAPGLALRPGRPVDVSFPDEGTYSVTVVGTTATVTVEAFTPLCEADPNASECIDDDVSRYGG